MSNIRDGPILKSTEGIDSIHIAIEINFYDVQRFCNDQKIKWEESEKTKWQRKGKIFLAGDPINVTYHFRSKRSTLEFGGFLDYTKDSNKLQLLRTLVHYFPDRYWSVSRLDYALDVNMGWDMFLPDMRGSTLGFSGTTTYFNYFDNRKRRQKLFTVVVYDKARQIGLFSTPLTRIELRLLRPELKRLKLMEMFDSEATLMKAANLIYSTLETCLKLHSVDGGFVYRIKTDVVATLQGFLEFLHSDMPTICRPDPFRIHYGLTLSKRVIDWLNEEDILPQDAKKHLKGKKIATCKSLKLDRKTFDKAIICLSVIQPISQL